MASIDTEDAPPPPSGLARLERVLGGLNERLAEPYQFDIFVPGSYNFGVLTTYRQRWQPLEYQVGNLVASMPLSPGGDAQLRDPAGAEDHADPEGDRALDGVTDR